MIHTFTWLLTAFVSAALLGGDAQASLIVASFTPERHARFENSPSFVGNPYDWSGVGRSPQTTWGTLISPSYVVGAAHLAPTGTMRFYAGNDPAGSFVERTVSGGVQIVGSDLYLARLDAPINPGSGISSYEIATFTGTSYVGREIFTFGLDRAILTTQADQRLGRNQIQVMLPNFSSPAVLGPSVGDAILYDYDTVNGLLPDESQVQGGDSGAPSFAIVSNTPALVGLHWFRFEADPLNPNPGSGDTFVSSYVDELNLAMLQLTPIGQPVETVRTVNVAAVPEPGSLALSALALMAIHSGGRLVRRRRGRDAH